MNSTAMLKLAASAVIMGSTMVGCSPSGQAMRPGNASDPKSGQAGAKAADAATQAIVAREFVKAVGFAEAAVASNAQDATYRMLLGQAYLGAGRFASAETTFADVLTLSPDQGRAALNLALVQIALGKKDSALRTLTDYRDRLGAGDYGLALALAGDTREAVRTLELATRQSDVDAKIRQNLALAYALDGQWNAAHVMAMQDLAPSDADARMLQWAEFARPDGGKDQVAALLGVQPVADDGQPARLALAPVGNDATQTAMGAPIKAFKREDASTAAPVMAVPSKPVFDASPVPAAEVAQPIVDTAPAVFETAPVAKAPVVAAVPVVRAPKAPAKQLIVPGKPRNLVATAAARAPRPVEAGKFVVQLGAFENAAVSRDVWKRTAARYGLAGFNPSNAAAKVNGASYVRLSVSGFQSRADASQICTRVRAAGGNCFVRGMLGDAPAQWVQRGLVKPGAKPVRVASR